MNLKLLINQCIREVISETRWDTPEEKSYSDVNKWMADNIKDGIYVGEPLHNYGFTYKVGQPVNMGKGHLLLAMRVWNDAKESRNRNLKLGRPVGFDEGVTESQYGAEDDMHYDGNDIGERDPNYTSKEPAQEYKSSIVIKKEPYGISVTPYNADGKICGGGLLHYSYQDDQYSDAIRTANHLKGKYPNLKYIDLIGSHQSQLIDPDSGESNQRNSFKQSEKDGGEYSHAPEMRVRSDEPQNDIHEEHTPMGKWETSALNTLNQKIATNDNADFIELLKQLKDEFSLGNEELYKIAVNSTYPVVDEDELKTRIWDLNEGFDPQSMGVNPQQPLGTQESPYDKMNQEMRKMEEDNDSKPRKGLLSPKGIATVEKWATTMDSRDAAKRMIDSVLRTKLGLTSDDLADTSTFANGLDMIEDLLKTRDWQGAYDVAKDTADEMIEEEGGGEMDENKEVGACVGCGRITDRGQDKCPKCRETRNSTYLPPKKNERGAIDPTRVPGVHSMREATDEDVDYVEYVSQRQGEEPFTLRTGNGQEKFEYVNGKYPSGKIDISVYAFRGDVCYGYNHFRKMFNLHESSINDVRPRDGGANIPKEPAEAPNPYSSINDKMAKLEEKYGRYAQDANADGFETSVNETLPPHFPDKLYKKLKAEYPNNDKAVYATAHKLSKKYGNKLEEIVEKSRCTCKNCGCKFEPTYGEYNRCPDCMSSQHEAGERATGTQ